MNLKCRDKSLYKSDFTGETRPRTVNPMGRDFYTGPQMRKVVECASLYKTDYKGHKCKRPKRITAKDVDIDLFKLGGK